MRRRPDSDLRWASQESAVGRALFLDTSVYLDVLQGRTPHDVDNLLDFRVCHHSAVCLAELTHVFGRLDPRHPSTKAVLRTVQQTIDDIPTHRLHAPEIVVWGQAGILAGELVRRSMKPTGQGHEGKFLNDALVYLQARHLGASVLTGNIRDFDYLNQLVPNVGLVFYRQVALPPAPT